MWGHWLSAPPNPRVDPYTAHGIDKAFKSVNQNVKEAIGDNSAHPSPFAHPRDGTPSDHCKCALGLVGGSAEQRLRVTGDKKWP